MRSKREHPDPVIRIGNLRLTDAERRSAERWVRDGEVVAGLMLRVGAALRSAPARLSGLLARRG